MTRRDASGSLVAMTFVKVLTPYGVLSVNVSSSICQFSFFSVSTMYLRT